MFVLLAVQALARIPIGTYDLRTDIDPGYSIPLGPYMGPYRNGKTHGSVSVGGGYSETGGWHGDVSVSISWAKQQERRRLISQLIELELAAEQEEENETEPAKNGGEVTVDGGYSQDGGWHVDTHVGWSWAKQQRRDIIRRLVELESEDVMPAMNRRPLRRRPLQNKGEFSLDGGYSQDQGWHGEGHLGWSWAKQQAAAPNFAIPPWVVAILKFALEEVLKDVVSKYSVQVYWEPHYEDNYKACIISLVHAEDTLAHARSASASSSYGAFTTTVKASVDKFVGGKFPIHLKFAKYNGNPSAIIYW